jgi:hypothetical protein
MDRGTRDAAASARRARYLLSGVLALAVLAGGGFYLARSVFSASPAAGQTTASPQAAAAGCGAAGTVACPPSPADIAVAVAPAVVTVPPRQAGHKPTPSASASSRSPLPRPSAPMTRTASAQPSMPASAPASTSPAQDGSAAAQVLALINQARSSAGLPALTVTSGLEASSSAHNLKMAGGCGLSHQCPG